VIGPEYAAPMIALDNDVVTIEGCPFAAATGKVSWIVPL
jgi:hypothetical protein